MYLVEEDSSGDSTKKGGEWERPVSKYQCLDIVKSHIMVISFDAAQAIRVFDPIAPIEFIAESIVESNYAILQEFAIRSGEGRTVSAFTF